MGWETVCCATEIEKHCCRDNFGRIITVNTTIILILIIIVMIVIIIEGKV
jgi:hypothetical protein